MGTSTRTRNPSTLLLAAFPLTPTTSFVWHSPRACSNKRFLHLSSRSKTQDRKILEERVGIRIAHFSESSITMENDTKPENPHEEIKLGQSLTTSNIDQNSLNQKQPPTHADKSRRQICSGCQRPTPQACICAALPPEPIKLENTIVIVLQHPHELKLRNRSVPLLELCLDKESLALCVGRKFGEENVSSSIWKLVQPPNVPILLFPETESDSDTVSLSDAKKMVQQRLPTGAKLVLIVLDATWKYSQEMHRANLQHQLYPSNLLRVSLQANDFPENWSLGRFDIRTTPQKGGSSKSFMSTAECVAWAVSELGGEKKQPNLYSTLMKPLDLMVQKWNSFVKRPKIREKLPPKKRRKQN